MPAGFKSFKISLQALGYLCIILFAKCGSFHCSVIFFNSILGTPQRKQSNKCPFLCKTTVSCFKVIFFFRFLDLV